MIQEDYKARVKRHKAIKKKLSKIRIGLPKRVEFVFTEGIVISYPKQRKWIIKISGKKNPITHYTKDGNRNDVTKYKAKHLLKLAILKLIGNKQFFPIALFKGTKNKR